MDLLPRRKVVGNEWVYKVNNNNDWLLECYKSRFAEKGYVKRSCIGFNEIFSVDVKLTTVIRVLTTLIEAEELEQLDVNTTFLHGDLKE